MKKSISCLVLLSLACIASFANTSDGQSDGCKIYDITHPIKNNMPTFGSLLGAKDVIKEFQGKATITGTITVGTHLGTHVDAPSHIFPGLLGQPGFTVDALDLKTLMGSVLVVETPKDKNITSEVMQSLQIPPGTNRVIFKTANTDNRLMDTGFFVPNYTGFTATGADWLVKNTNITFVGIDYMSVAVIDEIVPVHITLLTSHKIIPVENLKLDGIAPGNYNVLCLPLKVVAEAAPVRCILLDAACH
ncbi:cyclase-like protein 2 [Coffea arabica]|uniref:Cyclase-like protein 2 n=1 Tax=Coffea arabica TaxID=13443 RepID=A0A6P6SB64_COFAR|nr:cyclase-like protein 2 [Coffea arabica]